jgi:hypothetical protein
MSFLADRELRPLNLPEPWRRSGREVHNCSRTIMADEIGQIARSAKGNFPFQTCSIRLAGAKFNTRSTESKFRARRADEVAVPSSIGLGGAVSWRS